MVNLAPHASETEESTGLTDEKLVVGEVTDNKVGTNVFPILLCTYRYYNTLGVCHQLSNGFEIKHDMLSGDEGVKVKSTRVSSNLNLENTPLLTMCTLVKIMQE